MIGNPICESLGPKIWDNSIWKPPVGKETPMLIQKPGLYSGGNPRGWDRRRGDMQIFVNVISRGRVFRHHR